MSSSFNQLFYVNSHTILELSFFRPSCALDHGIVREKRLRVYPSIYIDNVWFYVYPRSRPSTLCRWRGWDVPATWLLREIAMDDMIQSTFFFQERKRAKIWLVDIVFAASFDDEMKTKTLFLFISFNGRRLACCLFSRHLSWRWQVKTFSFDCIRCLLRRATSGFSRGPVKKRNELCCATVWYFWIVYEKQRQSVVDRLWSSK